VHGARLHQHVHVAGSSNVVGREVQFGGEQPPYPFKSGDSLLNLTRTHNVWPSFLAPHGPVIPYNIRDEPEPDTGTNTFYS
jgi:hypothetical protein